MFDLWRAELARFRLWALAAGVLHVGVVGFYARMIDPLQQPLAVYKLVAAVFWVAGLLLGLYQTATYRRPGTWLNLLHRPLSPRAIATSLYGAGATWLAVAVAVPIILVLVAQTTLTERVVDLRHWQLPIAGWLVALVGYLAGALALLLPKRYAVAALVISLLLSMSYASGPWMLLVQATAVALSAGLVIAAFKPDLQALPRQAIARATLAVPVIAATYLVLVALTIVYELGWILAGTHPLGGQPPRGGFVEASRAEPDVLLREGLTASAHPQAGLWREQLALSKPASVGFAFDLPPERHEMTNPAPLEIDDDERRLVHVFSHDLLRFVTRSLSDGSARGALGAGSDGSSFPAPAMPVGDSWLVAENTLFQYDGVEQSIVPRLSVASDELIASRPEPLGDKVLLLTQRALYAYDSRELLQTAASPTLRYRLPLPAPAGAIERVDLFEVLDGHLVSVLTGHGLNDGPGEAQQTLWLALDGEEPQEVGRRALTPDFPLLFRHYGWLLSPVLHASRDATRHWLATPQPLHERAPGIRPPPVIATMLALHLLALGLGAWWSRGAGDARRERAAWLLACALLGIPAAISLRLMRPDWVRPLPAAVLTAAPLVSA